MLRSSEVLHGYMGPYPGYQVLIKNFKKYLTGVNRENTTEKATEQPQQTN